jgi:hypothetical protein
MKSSPLPDVDGVFVTLFAGVIGLAMWAAVLSKNSNTPGVIGSLGQAVTTMIKAAVSPVTGGGK